MQSLGLMWVGSLRRLSQKYFVLEHWLRIFSQDWEVFVPSGVTWGGFLVSI